VLILSSPVADEPANAVQFGLLGPLLVVDGAGIARMVPAAKQRTVLAALLLGNGSTVSAASLIEAVWGAAPPRNAGAVLRTYLGRLRRVLGPAGERIVGHPPGWAVELQSSAELDLAEVGDLWQAALVAGQAGDWRQVSALLTRALSLWRGEPLADVPSAALARREVARLAELRMMMLEARIDAELQLGRHGELVAELRRLAAEHPLREHLRVQLMLACYRSAQQAAALEAYRDARATLTEELGVEPGPELREMHHKILTADRDLMTAAAARSRVTLGQGRDNSVGEEGLQAPVPRELPAAARYFTGRAAEVARLTEFAQEARAERNAAVSVITGMAGVGKTALAVHWAHQATGLFPDGQLYVNLRGFGPSAPPMEPGESIRLLLEALGVPPQLIPGAPQARAGLYRSLMAGKQVVIIADNARDAGQVRPLLPGSPGSMVIVPSRDPLTSLVAAEGACCVRLDVLGQAEAEVLLGRRLNAARVVSQPAAVAAIVELCGGLPLALVIASARAATRLGVPAVWLARELADGQQRLDALEGGDTAASVRAAFSWSATQLTGNAARMLRLLAVHPGPDITSFAAASLAGVDVALARQGLGELTRTHLLIEHVPGRYAFHDLVRMYAAELAHADCTDGRQAETAQP
jgi:DNA-binding SARP family transcriptional activator